MKVTIESAVSAFGASATAKLSNLGAVGQPEDQLRSPFEQLLADFAELSRIPSEVVSAVGESSMSDLRIRPDYAVTVRHALVGFVELKAPGKGADPRKFKDPHDKAQWQKLRSLPNLLYSDGNAFSLWHNGEIWGNVIKLDGNIETSGQQLRAPAALLNMFEAFLGWDPIAPNSAKGLAQTAARLCRLLRDEVSEELACRDGALAGLASDWRNLLFPDASNDEFADGYAQAVTFGMLMARAKGISLATSLHEVATELSRTSSLIGSALQLLTDNVENQKILQTSLKTLIRVLDKVEWSTITKDQPDAWLYFYEDFLEVYDNDLRKDTGSYYTPPEVVGAMVRLVDDVLKSSCFGLHAGLASSAVTVADPATGTGTFMLGLLRRIALSVEADEGPGAVPGAIESAVSRLIAFEMQLGPFAVAQVRILAEIFALTGSKSDISPRMFVTDTLGDPYDNEASFSSIWAPIGRSRKEANKIKRGEKITVVIGNPPYKERAKGRGGWVEGEGKKAGRSAPLATWFPPPDWGVGAHTKHLRNLYVYFWRWATWKVYDHDAANRSGVVCFITVAGFLAGPGFQKMRDYLRRTCDDIWVIDCSPEGHQPDVNTRIFQGVQQPVCIVMVSRSANPAAPEKPAKLRFRALPRGHRNDKFVALAAISLSDPAWIDGPSGWREPFLPVSTGSWSTYPALEDMFEYNGSGVMPGRTWVIAPDSTSLIQRWEKLTSPLTKEKAHLFHPHLRNGLPGDKHVNRIVSQPLPGQAPRPKTVADETGECVPPIPYAFRSFDRQFIIPDNRLINQPNPDLWRTRSNHQIYITAPSDRTPSSGPALTITGLIPDLHHYNGRGGRTFPLWSSSTELTCNISPRLVAAVAASLGARLSGEDLFAYVAGVAANSSFTARFQKDLSTPGLRIPITCDSDLFHKAATVGRQVIWLHTFGERMVDPLSGRPAHPPRLPTGRAPRISVDGAVPTDTESMPDKIDYDACKQRLLVGRGYIENVEPSVWAYEVSGKHVLTQWFNNRRKDRGKPIIGERRKPSPLGEIQPRHWLPEYTTELLNLLNLLGLLVDLEPVQARLLEAICSGPTISVQDLQHAGVLGMPQRHRQATSEPDAPKFPEFEDEAIQEPR
jgi:hypothetical protein